MGRYGFKTVKRMLLLSPNDFFHLVSIPIFMDESPVIKSSFFQELEKNHWTQCTKTTEIYVNDLFLQP